MKTLSSPRINSLTHFTLVVLLGIILILFSGTASAQAPVKGKKTDKMAQGELKEAKITARVITSVEEISPMRIKLNVLNPTGKQVRISILTFSNERVFQDAFRGREYNKILNFNSSAAGRYKIMVNGPKQSETRRFAIDSKRNQNLNESELSRENNSDIMAAIHKIDPTKIKLHLVNNTGDRVNYVFRNDKKVMLYSGVINTSQFSKSFDMSSVTDGKYTLEVNYKADKIASRTFDMQTVYNRSFTWTDKRGRPLKPTINSASTQ